MADEQEVRRSVQMKGTPGESAALYVGQPKRSRSYPNESEEHLLLTPKKRQKIKGTPEMYELYTVVSDINPKDEPQPEKDEHPSETDLKFMTKAFKVSKRSKDDSTKVGAIIVDPATGDTLGEGWNRMPAGCEEKFGWSKGEEILKTKYPYVLHAVRAAILDALKKKADLEGTTVYATLIPDHIDSQMIREVGIKRVVFVEDKYSEFAFTIASKRILDGLEWRQITMPKENKSKPEDSENSD